MPYPTEATVEADRLLLTRVVDDKECGSGSIQVPWRIDGVGQLMTSSATLMERPLPYHLVIELARGKINQVRSQAADWLMGGLVMPAALDQCIRDATSTFAKALMQLPESSAFPQAELALQKAYQAGHELTQTYMRQVFQLRHERQPRLDTCLTCRLKSNEPTLPLVPQYLQTFNSVTLPFAWRDLEPRCGQYDWKAADERLAWATTHGLKVIGGPLVDFGGRNLPDWLWDANHDLSDLARVMCEHVEQVVRRYHTRIRIWQITAGSNCAGTLACRDDELIWLTLRLAEAVRRVNPGLELIVGLAHPWGDYLIEQERTKTPFIFADDLLRTGIKPSALDLEIVMGISPRGSYCRDLLETSRLLDLYALLGVPIQATLGYPSSVAMPEQACPDQRVNLGYWRSGYSEESQADWAGSFAALAACKPYVRTVQWAHWSDAETHQFPNSGLIDTQDRPKLTLQALTRLRSEHIK